MKTATIQFIFDELNKNIKYVYEIKSNSQKSIDDRNKEIDALGNKNLLLQFAKDELYEALQLRCPYGCVMMQGSPYSYYRGENKFYISTKSSFYRNRNKMSGDYLRYEKLIAQLKIVLFSHFLEKLTLIDTWIKHNYSTVLVYCLAQHYGLETEFLDITSDFLTAMFFATTVYDKETNKYIPITDEYVSMHKEYEYGYFYKYKFSSPLMINNTLERSKNAEKYNKVLVNDIWPIGYQPLSRCSAQYGYFMYCNEHSDLNKDSRFEKYKFKQSSELSFKIYEICKGGATIFPYEGLNEFQDKIDNIRNVKIFSRKLLFEAISQDDTYKGKNIDDIVAEFKKHKVIILEEYDDLHGVVDDDTINRINDKYKDFDFEKYYGIKPWTRLIKYE